MLTNSRVNDFIDRLRFNGPAPTPGLSAESAAGLSTEQITARQRAARVRGLAARVRRTQQHTISEEEREDAVGLVPGTKQHRPTKARRISSKPARKLPGAGQPGTVIRLSKKSSDRRKPDRFAAARFQAARPAEFSVEEWALVQRALRREQARDRAAAAIDQLAHATIKEIR